MRLIDADALLYELSNQSFPQSGEYGRARYRFIADLRNAPTVDAVPVVHGHWVEHEEMLWDENTSAPYYKCSECGYDTRHDTPYCPNCGARMDAE